MKAPTPKADQLRALGEAKRERLNAVRRYEGSDPAPIPSETMGQYHARIAKARKLIPYAGKDKSQGTRMMGVKNRKAKP